MATCRLALFLVGLAVAGCDGSEEDAEPVEGKGYTYSAPEGWDDGSDRAQDDAELGRFRPDSLVVGDREADFTTNVNVVREGGLPDGMTAEQYAQASLAGLREPGKAGLPPELAETIEELNPTGIDVGRDTELDGEEAVVWTYWSSQNGRRVQVRQVAAVREGTGYTLTLTALPANFEEAAEALHEVVESWSWK
jgi:hypothetical protein